MTDFARSIPPRPLTLALAVVLALALAASGAFAALAHDNHAHDQETGGLTPDASPVANTGTGIVYLSIINTGTKARLLVDAQTDAARDVSLHTSDGGGDVMRMTEQKGGFVIEPGATLTLEPGGAHLMLENLNHDLRPGSTFTVTLSFEVAGEIELEVAVGADAPDGEPSQLGELLFSPAWSLPAPRLGDGPGGTPEATPHDSH